MGRPRTWTDRQLRRAVNASVTWEEVASRLGLSHGNPSVTRRARELGLDTSHFLRRGMVDTRPYVTEVLGDAIYDDHHEQFPDQRLRSLAGDIKVLEARRDTQIRQMRRTGVGVATLAEWADVSPSHVVQICRVDP